MHITFPTTCYSVTEEELAAGAAAEEEASEGALASTGSCSGSAIRVPVACAALSDEPLVSSAVIGVPGTLTTSFTAVQCHLVSWSRVEARCA